VLNEKTTVSEDDLKREYEKNKAAFLTPEKILVIDVVLFMIAGDKDSGKKAGIILSKIRDDPDMNPKNLEPDGTFIVREYELKKDKEKELYEAARKLREGELSGIITTPDSLHIIKIRQYSPENQLPFERVRGYIEGQLLAAARQKKLKEWEAELKKDAKIEIVEIKESEKKEDDSKK
jgi:PPIC-type PPIASE domain